jgi:group I intron endonuclease
MDEHCGIYEIECTANGRRYIGSSVNMQRRLRVHRSSLVSGRHVNAKLQSAWNKYGAGQFSFRVLVKCEPSDRLALEQRAIDSFDAAEKGFNLARFVSSPMLGQSHADNVRQRISLALKGRVFSDTTKEAISRSAQARKEVVSAQMVEIWKTRPRSIIEQTARTNTGKKRDAIARQNIGAASKVKWQDPDFRRGRLIDLEKARNASRTLEARAKLSAAQKARYLDPSERERTGSYSRGIKRSPETIERMRASALAREARKRAAKAEST